MLKIYRSTDFLHHLIAIYRQNRGKLGPRRRKKTAKLKNYFFFLIRCICKQISDQIGGIKYLLLMFTNWTKINQTEKYIETDCAPELPWDLKNIKIEL